jgi:CRISPR-associated protein Csm3
MKLQLLGYYRITGVLELITGLHIGKGKDDIEIGGKDNPVILTALDQAPFIPGSSLKGKLRSLLEWDTGVHPEGKVRGFDGNYSADDPVLKVFGVPAREVQESNQAIMGPTRVLVGDSLLATATDGGTWNGQSYDWRQTFKEGVWQTEEKNENTLNRITAMANPRPLERVPAGVQFAISIRYRIFDVNGDGGEVDRENFRWLLKGLALLEQDALGGGGSRGSGLITFRNLQVVDEKGQASKADLQAATSLKWTAPATSGR